MNEVEQIMSPPGLTYVMSRGLTLIAALGIGCTAPADDRVLPDTTAVPISERLPIVDSGAATLLPMDDADASFRGFRAAALDALSNQDTAFLYSILAADIKNSFGGDDSIAGFKRIWRMDDPNTAVWTALARVLRMGGQMQTDSTFVAPYVYAFWPDSIDAFEYFAITTPNALVRDEPVLTAPPFGELSHSILKLEEWQNVEESGVATDTSWARVSLPDGRAGWVRGVDLYSPVGWRAFFVKRNDRWIIQLFVAGD